MAGFRKRLRVAMRHRRNDRAGAGLSVRKVCDRAPVAQHEHPVGALGDFLKLGGDHEDAQALVGKLSDQRLNLGLGPDVDAAGRFVED
jgi:hypothetical protein